MKKLPLLHDDSFQIKKKESKLISSFKKDKALLQSSLGDSVEPKRRKRKEIISSFYCQERSNSQSILGNSLDKRALLQSVLDESDEPKRREQRKIITCLYIQGRTNSRSILGNSREKRVTFQSGLHDSVKSKGRKQRQIISSFYFQRRSNSKSIPGNSSEKARKKRRLISSFRNKKLTDISSRDDYVVLKKSKGNLIPRFNLDESSNLKSIGRSLSANMSKQNLSSCLCVQEELIPGSSFKQEEETPSLILTFKKERFVSGSIGNCAVIPGSSLKQEEEIPNLILTFKKERFVSGSISNCSVKQGRKKQTLIYDFWYKR